MPEPRTHEGRDVHIRTIVGFAAALAAGVLIAAGVSRLVYKGLTRQARRTETAPSPLARPALPPEPRLQTSPPVDLAAFRAREEKALDTYGWVDPANGIVHIPIAAAKKLLLQRGLPTRAGAAPAPAGPSKSGEPSR
jgi:hypothetical protein